MKALVRLLLLLALIAPNFGLAQAATAAPAPACRLFASNTIVNFNTKVRLDWRSTNASSGYLTDIGAIAQNGTAFVVPGKNTTYAASFTGAGGTIVCRVAVAVRAGGAGTSYGEGVLNVDGTSSFQGTSIDSAGSPISTGSAIDTGSGIQTGGGIDTGPIGTGIDTGSAVNTNSPIDTNHPIDTNKPANLGGTVTLPTAPSVTPSASAPASGSGLSGGIVPAECRGANTVANCDLCSLAQMGQNLANFLLGVTVPAAALLFAWAGILFFSSRGVPEQLNRAKKIFRSVVIGFVIALSAWVLVNTVMNMLIQGGDFKSWSWSSLSCAQTRTARLYNMDLSAYLQSSLPSTLSYTGGSGGSSYECASGTLQGNTCVDSSGNTVGSPTVTNSSSASGGAALGCSQYGSGYAIAGNQCYGDDAVAIGPALRAGQLTDSQQDQFQDECDDGVQASCTKLNNALGESSANAAANVKRWDAQVAAACESSSMDNCGKIVQAIMTNESGGNCSVVSGVGAQGCMQVMATTACGVNPSIDGCGTCKNWSDNTGSNCAAVRQALISDPALNIQTGTQELARLSKLFNGDPTLIAAAYNGGQKANNQSSTCAGTTVWACTANSGYAETRNYVVKVNNTLSKL